MTHPLVRAAAIVLLASPAAAQILTNGNFASAAVDPWIFTPDPTAEPLMVATVDTFQDKPMFRLNPGHDGSGGWAGGTLEQTVFLYRGEYRITGNLHIENLRTGTNSSGGRITVHMNRAQIFAHETTSINGLHIVNIPLDIPFRAVTEGEYTFKIHFSRPWRNSSPISIYHWAGNFAIKLPPCTANCDESTTPPLLNVDDFTCFINAFAEAQSLPHAEQITHHANCDSSTTAPVLNVDDFTCFINHFAQGCP